ncbi:transposase [Psychrobium sp. 1_MG-2023]|uniref:transposase n=1 Tax=Psychrobium sp. 1_MG-2023 TaxID=3062624 RepID=UPI000C343BD4|nr:transposase [Psychrobium sp. 1_MG-2023]MDP2561398.1 transposase [Psychrobium sp. 1_MG-2023]PKF54876.1 transposase [Alteromonadales bacterium alter-6D02]
MARLPRLNLPNIPQHVVQRGNNRQVTFVEADDYVVYLDKLKHYAKLHEVKVHAYVLMTNHVHLLVTPSTGKGVSQLMQSLGRYYVRYFNQAYKRTGTLWEGRYKSTLVDSDNYFLVVSRYIELNPVRAGMVEHPVEYTWSSYQHNGAGKNIDLITEHALYHDLGSTPIIRQERYRILFTDEIPAITLEEIKSATDKMWVLGSEKFKQQVEVLSGRRASPLPKGGDRKSVVFTEKRLK